MATSASKDTTQSSTPQASKELLDPMIPHNSREEVDRTPAPPKKHDEADVVEPMIPHTHR